MTIPPGSTKSPYEMWVRHQPKVPFPVHEKKTFDSKMNSARSRLKNVPRFNPSSEKTISNKSINPLSRFWGGGDNTPPSNPSPEPKIQSINPLSRFWGGGDNEPSPASTPPSKPSLEPKTQSFMQSSRCTDEDFF